MAKVLQGLGSFTGADFLSQVAEFLSDLQSLFGGFRERASKVRDALMASEVAFVVVSSPDPMAVGEAMFFVDHLQKHRMNAEALVMNRVRQAEDLPTPSADRLAGLLADANIPNATDLGAAFSRAWRDMSTWARRDALEVARAQREMASVPRHAVVPTLDEDVYDLAALAHVAQRLV
ncbi:MAG: hypothetical protein IPN17_03870 [Deltaproteobacteria bacterium]|nr:hypothetical protein [Deltaproteobacteria bacterium]